MFVLLLDNKYEKILQSFDSSSDAASAVLAVVAELALLVLLWAWLLPWVLKTVLQALRMVVHMALLMMGWFGWLALAPVVAVHILSASFDHCLHLFLMQRA